MDLDRYMRPWPGERRRVSSWNATGANRDHVRLAPGQTQVLGDLEGPGVVRHLWFTVDCDDFHYLQRMRLRFSWDGEDKPAVDVPFGAFFLCGFDRVCDVETPVIAVRRSRAGNADNPDPGRGGFNAYFAMPFCKHARLTVINGAEDEAKLFFYVDWEKHASLPSDVMSFHATYGEESTVAAGPKSDDRVNRTGRENYVILDVPSGQGTYLGCAMSVESEPPRPGKWYEGDDMIFIDGRIWPPALHGTGTEDYFNHAWGAHRPISSAQFGITHYERDLTGQDRFYDGRFTMYRLHLSDPVPFRESILVSIEHGHANDAKAEYRSVAYWYGSSNRGG